MYALCVLLLLYTEQNTNSSIVVFALFPLQMFWLALHGYVGTELATSAKQAIKIKIHDNITKSYGGVPLRTIILMVICMAMIGCWGKNIRCCMCSYV